MPAAGARLAFAASDAIVSRVDVVANVRKSSLDSDLVEPVAKPVLQALGGRDA